jgi:aspartate dehydrogenase
MKSLMCLPMKMNKMNVAFLGYGAIARIIHKTLSGKAEFNFVGIFDPYLTEDDAVNLQGLHCIRYGSLHDILAAKPDVVVEAANQTAAKENVPFILAAGIDVLSLSVGAYIDDLFMQKISEVNRDAKSGRIYFPSGALPGVDVLKAACIKSVESVELITRKPPRALAGAPGFDASLPGCNVVFSGCAREAVRLFPANVNIAATLSLAGIGPEKTHVTIIADPEVQVNVHQVIIRGEFGDFEATIRCKPSENPKTSMIAALSAIAALKNLVSQCRIGT